MALRELRSPSSLTHLEYHPPLCLSSTAALYGKNFAMASVLYRLEREIRSRLMESGCVLSECSASLFRTWQDPLLTDLEDHPEPLFLADILTDRYMDSPGLRVPPPSPERSRRRISLMLRRIRSELILPLREPVGLASGYVRITSPLPSLGCAVMEHSVAGFLDPLLRMGEEALHSMKLPFAREWHSLPFPALFTPHPLEKRSGILAIRMIPSQSELGTGALVRFRTHGNTLVGWARSHRYHRENIQLHIAINGKRSLPNREAGI